MVERKEFHHNYICSTAIVVFLKTADLSAAKEQEAPPDIYRERERAEHLPAETERTEGKKNPEISSCSGDW